MLWPGCLHSPKNANTVATHNVITANKWKQFLKKPEQNRYSDKKKERAAHGIKAAREPGIKSDEYGGAGTERFRASLIGSG